MPGSEQRCPAAKVYLYQVFVLERTMSLPYLQESMWATYAVSCSVLLLHSRLVPKQLDAHWVASRSIKPCMDTLFRPRDWQQGFVDPQILLLPAWPSPRDVVQQLHM